MGQRIKTVHSYSEAKLEAQILHDEGARDVHIRQRKTTHSSPILWDIYYTPAKGKLGIFGA